MRQSVFALLISALLSGAAGVADAASDPTAWHKRIYAEVNQAQQAMSRQTFTLEEDGAPVEPQVTVWSDGGGPRKAQVVYPGDHGRTVRDFYYAPVSDGMGLVFVYEAITTQAVDGSQASTRENRYYFQDDALFRWLAGDRQPVAPGTEDFKEQERDLIATSARILARMFGDDAATADPATPQGGPVEETSGRFAGIEQGDYAYLVLSVGGETQSFMILDTDATVERLLAAPEQYQGRRITVRWQRVMASIPEAGGRIAVEKVLAVGLSH